MSAGAWFWVVYVVAALFGAGWGWTSGVDRRWWGSGLILWILIGLLGWGIFGPPLR